MSQFWWMRPEQNSADLSVMWVWGVLKAFAFFFCLEHRHNGWCSGSCLVTMRGRWRESQKQVSWHSWATEPKGTATYLWSHYIRKTNLCWITASRVRCSVSCTKHNSNWYRGSWRKLLPKWLDFTQVWELKTNSEDNLIRCLEPKGTAPAPVRTEESCQISLPKAQNSPPVKHQS